MAHRYFLLGVDLDGTLLRPDGSLSDANRDAVAAAHDAGVLVVPCTGRSWRESRRELAALPPLEVGVFLSGAQVARLDTGESLDLGEFEPHVAKRLIDALADEPEAVLAFRDANLVGHDYLVTGRGALTDNTRWWFEFTDAAVHEQPEVTADDLHHVLRVGMVTTGERAEMLRTRLGEAAGDLAYVHSFAAITRPDDDDIHVLEAFAAGVHKWRGLDWIAAERGIPRERIAVIGDEINDVAMFEHAGLSIAMGNAIPRIKALADRVAPTNTEDGVAYAIGRVLEGAW